jgi:hypothetical protein
MFHAKATSKVHTYVEESSLFMSNCCLHDWGFSHFFIFLFSFFLICYYAVFYEELNLKNDEPLFFLFFFE